MTMQQSRIYGLLSVALWPKALSLEQIGAVRAARIAFKFMGSGYSVLHVLIAILRTICPPLSILELYRTSPYCRSPSGVDRYWLLTNTSGS